MNFNRNASPDILAGGDASSTKDHLCCSLKPEEDQKSECHALTLNKNDEAHPHGLPSQCNAIDVLFAGFHPSTLNEKHTTANILHGSDNSSGEGDEYTAYMEQQQDPIKSDNLNKTERLPESEEGKATKYKFDNTYLAFIQNFTSYCEDRAELLFDGSAFFDDDFFPRSMQLTEFVPINAIAPFVEKIEMQVPSSSDYCKYAPCGSTIYDYFEDYQAFINRETILRNQVIFILKSLHCPRLTSLEIDSTPVNDESTDRYPVDRLSTWNDNLSSFISRHAKTLKNIQIQLIRYKGLRTTNSYSNADMRRLSKKSFPKLHSLTVTLWDNQISTSAESDLTDSDMSSSEREETHKNVWLPKWIPDMADQYWISLMKSQVHGLLTKLDWVSAANLGWDELFQPILDSNRNSLEYIQIIEIDGMLDDVRKKDSSSTSRSKNCSPSSFYSTSSAILSCAAFSRLHKLKKLSLRKTNCYLTELNKLPEGIEELSIDDMHIKSSEIATLASLSRLKILRLANSAQNGNDQSQDNANGLGVNRDVLKEILHSRSLQELCIWHHCLGLDMNELSNQTAFNLTSVLDKINSYLTNICKSSHKISPSQFCDWNSEQFREDKILLEALENLGYIDEECIAIHNQQ